MGISHGMYGYVLVQDAPSPADTFSVSAYPVEYMVEYERLNAYQCDEAVDWCRTQDRTLIWAPRLPGDADKRSKELIELGRDVGIAHGFSIPLKESGSASWGGVGLSATHISESEFTSDILR